MENETWKKNSSVVKLTKIWMNLFKFLKCEF